MHACKTGSLPDGVAGQHWMCDGCSGALKWHLLHSTCGSKIRKCHSGKTTITSAGSFGCSSALKTIRCPLASAHCPPHMLHQKCSEPCDNWFNAAFSASKMFAKYGLRTEHVLIRLAWSTFNCLSHSEFWRWGSFVRSRGRRAPVSRRSRGKTLMRKI